MHRVCAVYALRMHCVCTAHALRMHCVCTAYALRVQVRSRPIRWITGVHVAKLCIAGLVAADAAQQAAADPSRPLGGLLLRVLVVWMTLASLVSFAVSWRTDSQADLRLVWLLSLIAIVPEATELVLQLV